MQAKIYEAQNNIETEQINEEKKEIHELSKSKKYYSDEYDVFNLKTSLRPEDGGNVVISKLHESIIIMEACGDSVLKESLLAGSTPLIDTVYR
jgi:hypothetical protein